MSLSVWATLRSIGDQPPSDANLATHRAKAGGAGLGLRAFERPDQPLVERSLPGMTIELPDWSTQTETLDPASGQLVLAAPSGRSQEIKLNWLQSTPTAAEDALHALPPNQVAAHEIIPYRVAGTSTETLLIELVGKNNRLVATSWSCPDDSRSFTLFSFLEMARDDHLWLHGRLLSSVRCDEPPELVLKVPELSGLSRIDGPGGVAYITPQGEELYFSAANPDAESRSLLERPELRQLVFRSFGLDVSPGTFSTARPLGPLDRPVWSGVVTDPQAGERLHALLTVFECDGGRTHYGFHLSPTRPRDEVATLLASATCPST